MGPDAVDASDIGEDAEPMPAAPAESPGGGQFPRSNVAGTRHYDESIVHQDSQPYQYKRPAENIEPVGATPQGLHHHPDKKKRRR